MTGRIVEGYPYFEGKWRVTPRIDTETGKEVGSLYVATVDPEIQNQVDEICKKARLRREQKPFNKMLRRLKEVFNIF